MIMFFSSVFIMSPSNIHFLPSFLYSVLFLLRPIIHRHSLFLILYGSLFNSNHYSPIDYLFITIDYLFSSSLIFYFIFFRHYTLSPEFAWQGCKDRVALHPVIVAAGRYDSLRLKSLFKFRISLVVM